MGASVSPLRARNLLTGKMWDDAFMSSWQTKAWRCEQRSGPRLTSPLDDGLAAANCAAGSESGHPRTR